MSLQLILGGSGSGKTTCLYDAVIQASIKNPQQQYYVLVPEQFTMQAQKDVVARHPAHGTMNIDVVSFQRLAYRIFEEWLWKICRFWMIWENLWCFERLQQKKADSWFYSGGI